jgi:hypothetical protein
MYEELLSPVKLWSRDEVIGRAAQVPRSSGVYAWYFKEVPPGVPANDCMSSGPMILLYAGISPKEPPRNGRPPSHQTLADRVRYHYTGNAEGSTLRLTLGCLLAERLGIQLRRVGSGKRMTFSAGENILSEWMAENAFVTWMTHDEPWIVERDLFRNFSFPLNLADNLHHPYRPALSAERSRAKAIARKLPVLER